MRTILDKYLTAFAREADKGGGGAQGTGGGAQGAGGDAGGTGGDGGGGGDGGSGGGAAGPGAGQDGPPSPYFPEGLPDTMRGENERATMDNMAKALKGFRDRDATREVPKDPGGYLSLEGVDPKSFKLDDAAKPHFDFLAKDPGAQAALKVFHEAGVDRGVVRNAIGGMFNALQQAGVLEPLLDVDAERQALLPDAAKTLPKQEQDAAIDRRMQENEDFIGLMTQNRALPAEAGEYAKLMLMDSAKGNQFLEWMRGQIQGGGDGEGPGQHGGGGGGGESRETLKAELAAMEKKRGGPDFDKAAYEALDARYKKMFAS